VARVTLQRTRRLEYKKLFNSDFFDQIENLALDVKAASQNVHPAMDMMAEIMANVHHDYARIMSLGPIDRLMTRPQLAWKIPVRRITQRYFNRWQVKRVGHGAWFSFNDSREAFYIEFGIHTSGRRVRRPIRKLATIKTLRFVQSTKVGYRVWDSIYAPMRGLGPHGGMGPSNVLRQGIQRPNFNFQMMGGV
jgi:hypothetical protein